MEPRLEFSGEEAYGRFLDLHALHHQFCNSPFGRKVEYLAYLDCVSDFRSLPRGKKFHPGYKAYLQARPPGGAGVWLRDEPRFARPCRRSMNRKP